MENVNSSPPAIVCVVEGEGLATAVVSGVTVDPEVDDDSSQYSAPFECSESAKEMSFSIDEIGWVDERVEKSMSSSVRGLLSVGKSTVTAPKSEG